MLVTEEGKVLAAGWGADGQTGKDNLSSFSVPELSTENKQHLTNLYVILLKMHTKATKLSF